MQFIMASICNLKKEVNMKQIIVSTIIHLICIFIFIFLPEIIMNIGDPHHQHIPTGVYVRSFIYILAFYINYFFIFDKCIDDRRGLLKFAFYNLLILITAIFILYIVWDITAANKPIHAHNRPYLPPPPPEGDLRHQPGDLPYLIRSMGNFVRDGIILLFIIGLCVAIKLSQRMNKMKQHKQELIASQQEEELNNLKNQLNPHFLFNTLNSIYALIDICPSTAKNAVHELSSMLRYVVYSNPETVDLKSEIKFIQNYIDLMTIRFGDTANIDVCINMGNSENHKIAPLIFITIIENVFKHGNTGDPSHPLKISISANDGHVTCHTFNYYNPNSKSNDNGIGISSLKRRLALIYGDKANFAISKTKDTYTTILNIDLN